MGKPKTAASVKWFTGEKVDARIVIIMCLDMIARALKAIAKEKKGS